MKPNVVADFKPTDDNPNEELWHKLGCVRLHGISRLFQLEAKISKKLSSLRREQQKPENNNYASGIIQKLYYVTLTKKKPLSALLNPSALIFESDSHVTRYI